MFSDSSGDDAPLPQRPAASAKRPKTVEETYQKMEQAEHVLARADMYVGSLHRDNAKMWVFDEDVEKMVERKVSYVPGLYKIFDEIIVNAADNKVRDPKMDTLKVSIDAEKGEITVWNNGAGLPVEMHKQHNMYVPSLVFGVLLTSSNYDDDEKRVTGGRNGYGAKLTNILSTKFTVETYDTNNRKLFKQTWTQNMEKAGEPRVTTEPGRTSFTCITFRPDLSKFGMTRLDDDIVALMKKRVWDMTGCGHKNGFKVHLNGKSLPVRGFKEYVKLYPIGDLGKLTYEEINERWTVCIASSTCGFQQVSFVNSIWTSRGGKHVDCIANQVVEHLKTKLNSKKNVDVKPAFIRPHLFVFVKCLIENAGFDSQSKETMSSPMTTWGGKKPQLSEKLLAAIAKADFVRMIEEYSAGKLFDNLNKAASGSRRRLTGIAKYEAANAAGGREAHKCTLVLTEGDSAKALAMSGFSVVGRDYWGVLPLRGKVLNVREAAPSTVLKNAEVQAIMKILGLKIGTVYTNVRELNYGHLMIMADQDYDGSHIKGLIINFIHNFWPSILENCPGFLVEFATPIIKVTRVKGAEENKKVLSFFSIPEYNKWLEDQGADATKKWKPKYYKGLGTSTRDEAKDYFAAMERHRITFEYEDEEDNDAVLLAFDRQRADMRKAWMNGHREGSWVDHNIKSLRVKDFVNKELVLYAISAAQRSIPSVVDGFKPSQRKVLFGCFKRKGMERNEIKVAQLTSHVSNKTEYHHGEAALQQCIIAMAQDFVGSNNINLLEPRGQFGTRIQGGKDAAQARYIFTQLSPVTRALFPAVDDDILQYKEEDGMSVEPEYFVPILPLCLINGQRGIGVGYATAIPSYNPKDLVEFVKAMLNNEDVPELTPWYRGFSGTITKTPKGVETQGLITKHSETVVNITELPIGEWTEDYKKSVIDPMMEKEIIYDYREHHTDLTVDFELQLDPETMREWVAQGFVERLNLSASISMQNMVAFDANGRTHKYASAEDMAKDHFKVRLEFYRKRKAYLVEKLNWELDKLKHMLRFVIEVVTHKLEVRNKKKIVLVGELKERGYKTFMPMKRRGVVKGAVDMDEDEEQQRREVEEDALVADDDDPTVEGYNYLLSMKIWSLTFERVELLKKKCADTERELATLLETTPEAMWHSDLDNFLEVWEKVEQKRADKDSKHAKKTHKPQGRLAASRVIPKKSEKGKKAEEEEKKKKKPAVVRTPRAPRAPKDKKETKPTATKKRKRTPSVASSDSDSSDDSPAPAPRPKATPAPRPAQRTTLLLGSDSESSASDSPAFKRQKRSTSPVTATDRIMRTRKTVSYVEADTDDEDELSE